MTIYLFLAHLIYMAFLFSVGAIVGYRFKDKIKAALQKYGLIK